VTAGPSPVPSLRDWAFAAYERPGVQEACLALQDRHGMDVVALLWCIWAGEHHGVIDAEAMGPILADTAAWQAEIVAPLRAVRRRLKHADDVASSGAGELALDAGPHLPDAQARLRRQVADAELAAEVIQLERLDAATQASSRSTSVVRRTGAAAVHANLAGLVVASGSGEDHDRDRMIATLVSRLSGTVA
jgi:uncharacterized protein (TIGR02444 family)